MTPDDLPILPCTRTKGHGLNLAATACRFCGLPYPYGTTRPKKPGTNARVRSSLMRRDGSWCWWCGVPLTKGNSTADHVLPKSKGGNGRRRNLVLCCYSCNQAKGDSHPLAWIATLVASPDDRLPG